MFIVTRKNNFEDYNFVYRMFDDIVTDICRADCLFNDLKEDSNFHSKYDKETKEHLIDVIVPGFKKEDLSIEYINDKIIIKGDLKDNKNDLLKNSICYEKNIKNLDIESVKTKLSNGVLEIRYKEKNNAIKFEIKES